jgi:uncharacterized protein YkwD
MNKLLILIGSLIVAFSIGLMITQAPQPTIYTPIPLPTPIELNEQKLEDMSNVYRASQNKNQLKHDQLLCDLADTRLPQIKVDFSHDEFVPLTKIYYAKHSELAGIGENLAKDFYTEVATFGAWLDSPTHKNNLDSYWETTCVKCEQTTCIQVFGRYF